MNAYETLALINWIEGDLQLDAETVDIDESMAETEWRGFRDGVALRYRLRGEANGITVLLREVFDDGLENELIEMAVWTERHLEQARRDFEETIEAL